MTGHRPNIQPLVLAVLLAATPLAGATASDNRNPDQTTEKAMQSNRYVGMWVTDDGYIRHELLPNGRYDEARGTRQSAYRGRYEIKGTHIDYWDDTGFTADGEFVDDNTLHHGGMVFRRR